MDRDFVSDQLHGSYEPALPLPPRRLDTSPTGAPVLFNTKGTASACAWSSQPHPTSQTPGTQVQPQIMEAAMPTTRYFFPKNTAHRDSRLFPDLPLITLSSRTRAVEPKSLFNLSAVWIHHCLRGRFSQYSWLPVLAFQAVKDDLAYNDELGFFLPACSA